MSKGKRNRTIRNERRTKQMEEQNINMEEMRLKRIANHPLDVKGNYIVVDNLEGSVIEVFLHTDEDSPLNITSADKYRKARGGGRSWKRQWDSAAISA